VALAFVGHAQVRGKDALQLEVTAAIEFLRSKGVTVEPIEKSVVEG